MATFYWRPPNATQSRGPYSFSDLKDMVTVGTIQPYDVIRQEGRKAWKDAIDVDGLYVESGGPLEMDVDVRQDYSAQNSERPLDAQPVSRAWRIGKILFVVALILLAWIIRSVIFSLSHYRGSIETTEDFEDSGWLARRASGAVRVLPVGLSSIPATARISVPIEFTPPANLLDSLDQEIILRSLNENPGNPSSYSSLLRRRWGEDPGAFILVGELGRLAAIQGRISPAAWREILDEAGIYLRNPESLRRAEEMLDEIVEGSGIEDIDLDVGDRRLFEEDGSVVTTYSVEGFVQGSYVTSLGAKKIMYSEGYVIFTEISVDARLPQAEDSLRHYLSLIGFVLEE